MIKTRLLRLVPGSLKYIFANVLLQWTGLICNAGMIMTIAALLTGLKNESELSYAGYAGGIALLVLMRTACIKLAASASYHASRSVKRTLRGRIYEKLLRLGNSYRQHITTAELVQLAGEGVEQLEAYFGSYLPQFFYAVLAPLTLFLIFSRISIRTAAAMLVCIPLIPVSIVIVQKIATRLLSRYWGQYAVLGDSFLENLQGLTTLKIYQADERRHREMNEEAEHFRKITMKVLSILACSGLPAGRTGRHDE